MSSIDAAAASCVDKAAARGQRRALPLPVGSGVRRGHHPPPPRARMRPATCACIAGLRLAPDPDDLRKFVEAASSMDGLLLAELLREKMVGGWARGWVGGWVGGQGGGRGGKAGRRS